MLPVARKVLRAQPEQLMLLPAPEVLLRAEVLLQAEALLRAEPRPLETPVRSQELREF
jgi:hypothetical protein